MKIKEFLQTSSRLFEVSSAIMIPMAIAVRLFIDNTKIAGIIIGVNLLVVTICALVDYKRDPSGVYIAYYHTGLSVITKIINAIIWTVVIVVYWLLILML